MYKMREKLIDTNVQGLSWAEQLQFKDIKNWFARSFVAPETGKNVSDNFLWP
jgi:hypothetical protein